MIYCNTNCTSLYEHVAIGEIDLDYIAETFEWCNSYSHYMTNDNFCEASVANSKVTVFNFIAQTFTAAWRILTISL